MIKIFYFQFKIRNNVFKTFKTELDKEGGVGTLPELYNSEAPIKSGGTFSQAWSVSEVLKIVSKLK